MKRAVPREITLVTKSYKHAQATLKPVPAGMKVEAVPKLQEPLLLLAQRGFEESEAMKNASSLNVSSGNHFQIVDNICLGPVCKKKIMICFQLQRYESKPLFLHDLPAPQLVPASAVVCHHHLCLFMAC